MTSVRLWMYGKLTYLECYLDESTWQDKSVLQGCLLFPQGPVKYSSARLCRESYFVSILNELHHVG